MIPYAKSPEPAPSADPQRRETLRRWPPSGALTLWFLLLCAAGLRWLGVGGIGGGDVGREAAVRAGSVARAAAARSEPPAPFAPAYPLGSAAFAEMVADSYRRTDGDTGHAPEFFRWLDAAYARRTRLAAGPPPKLPGVPASLPLGAALDAEKARLAAIRDPQARAREEKQLAAWSFWTLKRLAPRFDLWTGFEFANMVRRGERQCLAQSVLVAAFLQRAGMPAGVAMVWKNNRGIDSNNGHCVTMARLSSGRQIMIDASEKRNPFPHHRGLFVAEGAGYRFVRPVWANGDDGPAEIAGYASPYGGQGFPLGSVHTLDLPFIRSQFDYYRAERAPGGPFDRSGTRVGFAAAGAHLENAVRRCPANPLPVYMLGKVWRRLGRDTGARVLAETACREYRRCGYLPDGPAAECGAARKRPGR